MSAYNPLALTGCHEAASESFGSRVAGTFFAWFERARQRSSLAGLDDRMLKDVGLTRADRSREADKSFWQS